MSAGNEAALAALARLTVAVSHLKIVTYFSAAGSTIFVYDFLLTFDREVEQIWKAPWTFMKGAYILQRYLPFFDTVYLSNAIDSIPNITPETCLKQYTATITMAMSSILFISEGILTFRTWAVWARDMKIGIIMWTVFFAFFAGSFGAAILAIKGLIFSKFPIPTRFNFSGCFLTGGNISFSIVWTLLLAYDAWMVSWLGVRCIQIYRHGGHNALMTTVFRDGIIYYIYLLLLSTINAIICFAAPRDLSYVLAPVERVLVSILTSRVILGIRSTAARQLEYEDSEIG